MNDALSDEQIRAEAYAEIAKLDRRVPQLWSGKDMVLSVACIRRGIALRDGELKELAKKWWFASDRESAWLKFEAELEALVGGEK